MRNLKRSQWIWLLSGLGLLLFYGLQQSCAPEPRYKKLKVGETITILPSKPEEAFKLKDSAHRGVRLSIKWGERPISQDKGDPILRFFDSSGKVRYQFAWSQLARAYKDTGCNATEVAYLDGYLAGEALICDGTLDLRGITLIEGELPQNPIRRATSWGTYALGPDAVGVSIGLFQ
jgi:hypothetical protein